MRPTSPCRCSGRTIVHASAVSRSACSAAALARASASGASGAAPCIDISTNRPTPVAAAARMRLAFPSTSTAWSPPASRPPKPWTAATTTSAPVRTLVRDAGSRTSAAANSMTSAPAPATDGDAAARARSASRLTTRTEAPLATSRRVSSRPSTPEPPTMTIIAPTPLIPPRSPWEPRQPSGRR